MSVFGGMSKGERNRIGIRVRAAMASQAKIEGRFLGGRPPYGYRVVDAGPHPTPAKAADGKRLHRLKPDPVTAPVVHRIFTEYVGGRGLFAIAEGLTRDGLVDLCDDLGISRSTFYDWRAKRKAPRCLKLPNGDLRIRRSDYENWLSSLEEDAA